VLNIAKTKILLFWNGMTSDQVSGGDIYIKQLVELSEPRYDIVLNEHAQKIITSDNVSVILNTDSKSPVSNLGIISIYIKRAFRSALFARHSLIKNKDYDVILSSSPFVCDILPATFVRSKKRAVILFHLIPERRAKNLAMYFRFLLARFEQKISLEIIRHYFQIILVGNEELRIELSKLMPDKQLVIAHAGIDIQKIDKSQEQKRDPDLALFVGRLTTQKGIFDLVEIVKKVQTLKPNFRLVIVGNGPHRKQLIKAIDEAGVNGISLAGFIDEKAKYDLLKRANFFLFPSYEEGWGIALAEGLYAGCKVVCYEIDHYRGIFDKYPYYVGMGDKEAFSQVIIDNYKARVDSGQSKFISRYDYSEVINNVISQI